jgi:hypothetical protein
MSVTFRHWVYKKIFRIDAYLKKKIERTHVLIWQPKQARVVLWCALVHAARVP